jgi:hypothetical protein
MTPREGDDDDRDSSFWWGRFGPGWTHVAPTQAQYGAAAAAGCRPGDALAGAGRRTATLPRMAAHTLVAAEAILATRPTTGEEFESERLE